MEPTAAVKKIRIASAKSRHFPQFWKLFEKSFPKDERFSLRVQKKLFGKKGYCAYALFVDGKFAGLEAGWQFPKFNFVGFLALEKQFRNKGIGTALLRKETAAAGKLIVLEAEPRQKSAKAKRRIAFYKRLGFKLNSGHYAIPDYYNKKAIPMMLMSFARKLSKKEFVEVRLTIHTKAYGLDKPIVG